MPLPILQTKLHRPQASRDHVHRESIIKLLDQSLHLPLALVSAPAGYGKSTLVSCWLEACNIPNAWVSLDEHDNDLRLFLTYFANAIQRIVPRGCAEILSMLEFEHLPPFSVMARTLINGLDQIGKAFILVLDDYHLIREKSVHRLIDRLLQHPSRFMHLVLIGRRDPPLPLSSLRAKGQMIEIRTQNLQFSLEATRILLQQVTENPIHNSVAAILEEKTEGWVTGLRLAAFSLRHRKDLIGILANQPMINSHVMDYFVTEILNQQPPSAQAYLLKTSILNRFCAPLCDSVCGANKDSGARDLNGRKFLQLVKNDNLFVIPLDDEGKWFRYHHLFQGLLKRQLKKRMKEQDIIKLHKLASAWFAENGDIEEALRHAHEIGDHEAAARLVTKHRHDMMNQEQWHRLNRCLQNFPSDIIQENTDLLLVKAWSYQRQARYSELFDILDKLEHKISTSNQESDASSDFWGELQTLKSFQHYAAARGDLSEASARAALSNLPAQSHSIRGLAYILLSVSLQMQGDLGQAQGVVLEALQKEEASIPVCKTALLAALCLINWIAADLNSLKQAAAQLLKHGRKHDLPESIAFGSFFTGILHYQRNELDLAERVLAPVVRTPGTGELIIPSIVTQCQSSFALSLTYQAMGRAENASQILESVIDYMLETGNADLLELCQTFRADLALCQGNFAEADFWARNCTPTPLAPAYRFYIPHLTLPKVLLARRTAKSLSEADKLLSQMHGYYKSIHSTRVLIDVLVLQVMLHAVQGNEPEALEKLAEALALAEPGGFIRPFLEQGPEVANLLGHLAKQNPKPGYAGRILDAFGSGKTESISYRSDDCSRSRPSLPDEPLVQPLTNREIEVLKKLANGLSNKKIANALFISPETVKKHLSTIYRKMDVKNRQQAIISAKSIGIL
jgi:LuxR family maltose regulon positive regulatory protein